MSPNIRTQRQKYPLAKWKVPYEYAVSINVSRFWGTDSQRKSCLWHLSAIQLSWKVLTAPAEQGMQHRRKGWSRKLEIKGQINKGRSRPKAWGVMGMRTRHTTNFSIAEKTRERIKVSGRTLFCEFPMALKTHMANRFNKKDRVHSFCYGPSYGLGPCVRK